MVYFVDTTLFKLEIPKRFMMILSYLLKWNLLIKIADTETKMSNSIIQQIQDIDLLPAV